MQQFILGLHQVPEEQQGQLGQPDEAGPSLQGYSSPDDLEDLPGLRQVLQRRRLPKLRWLRLRWSEHGNSILMEMFNFLLASSSQT